MSMNLQCESKYIKMMGRLKATSLCLVPISISISIKPLSAIIDSHSIIHHSFADDLQLQMSAPQITYLSYFTQYSHV